MSSAGLTSIQAPREPAVGTQPLACRGWGRRASEATARWLRRALAESLRAWAVAAGVPPHLYPDR